MSSNTSLTCTALVGLSLICAGPIAAKPVAPAGASQAQPAKVGIRRITETQYRHTIADVFGPATKINARFEPEKRESGLLALGSAQLSLTSSGFEQYFALANSISDQVLSETRRDEAVGCKPGDASKPDDGCARQFIRKYGDSLFRRPLTDAEILARVKTAATGATQAKDFYAGLKLALTSLLIAPEFIFRIETAEADPDKPGQYRLDAYTKASRVSFLFWDTVPDQELLDSARSGAIHTDAGLKQQLLRMSASPRFKEGTLAFFTDMLQLDGFDNLIKDPAVYPKFNQSVADAAREQTRRTTVDLLVAKNRDYRDLFTSNDTFINRYLAAVYQVPFNSAEEWAPYSFPESSDRSGILTQVSFLSMFSHPGGSSPTKRGIKVHEIFMCEPTPEAPANVDFSKVRDSTKGTVRGRLLDHMENDGCTSCHRRSDPPGLALEHFDGLGQVRKLENGAPIDVSVDLSGQKFDGARGLAGYLHDSPKVPACLVKNVYAYGIGRKTTYRDESYVTAQANAFAQGGYHVSDLMVQIASTPEFFKVSIPGAGQPATTAAAEPEKTAGVTP